MKMLTDRFISVIVPVYNGEHTITELTTRIKDALNSSRIKFELIFVHDCGIDNSLDVFSRFILIHKLPSNPLIMLLCFKFNSSLYDSPV